jgi:molybdopterin converting factor small subunit
MSEYAEERDVADVTVRYWAAARSAAGCESEQLSAVTLADVIAASGALHGQGLAMLLDICAYLIDGSPAKRADAARTVLTAGAVIEVLPPFAGG